MSVEKSWREGGEERVLEALVIKYCKTLDMTDSGRDIRPLANGLLETIDRLKKLRHTNDTDTPLARVRRMVELERLEREAS